jgi:CBS domain-containing protein
MTVARILANKGRSVVTTLPERTLQEVSVELMRHGIGALVVVDANDDIVGLISERDVVMAVADHGPRALLDAVARHMTANPRAATEDDTVGSTMETITLEHQRHLPVVNNGELTGLISIGDVVKYRLDQIENERKALHDYITKA